MHHVMRKIVLVVVTSSVIVIALWALGLLRGPVVVY